MRRTDLTISGNVIDASRLFAKNRKLSFLLLVKNGNNLFDPAKTEPSFRWVERNHFLKTSSKLSQEGWNVFFRGCEPYLGTGQENPLELLRGVMEKRLSELAATTLAAR